MFWNSLLVFRSLFCSFWEKVVLRIDKNRFPAIWTRIFIDAQNPFFLKWTKQRPNTNKEFQKKLFKSIIPLYLWEKLYFSLIFISFLFLSILRWRCFWCFFVILFCFFFEDPVLNVQPLFSLFQNTNNRFWLFSKTFVSLNLTTLFAQVF